DRGENAFVVYLAHTVARHFHDVQVTGAVEGHPEGTLQFGFGSGGAVGSVAPCNEHKPFGLGRRIASQTKQNTSQVPDARLSRPSDHELPPFRLVPTTLIAV